MSVRVKNAAFVCIVPSEKRCKELKVRKNKELTRGLDVGLCHDLKSTPSVMKKQADFFFGVAR